MSKLLTILLLFASLISLGQTIMPGSIASDQFNCSSCLPVLLTSTPPNGTAPTYQWQMTPYADPNTFYDISQATCATYQPPYLTVKTYYRQVQKATGVTGGPLPTNNITINLTRTAIVRLLQNDTITTVGCYNASDSLTVASDSAHAWRVTDGGYVSMYAGQSIILLPGTKFDTASYVHLYIRSLLKTVNGVAQSVIWKLNGTLGPLIKKVNRVSNY